MTGTPLQSVATWTTAFRQQLKLLSLSKRVWILIAFCTVPLLFSEVLRVQRIRTTGGLAFDSAASHPAVDIVWGIILASAVWPLMVWRGESWGRRSYHWSLPVDQVKHDLTRVLAGGVWLLVAALVAAMLAMVFLHLHGAAPIRLPNGSHSHFWPDLRFWAAFFIAPLIVYLLGSILPLCVNRPAEWTLAFLTAYLATLVLLPLLGLSLLLPWWTVVNHPYGLGTALTSQTIGRFFEFLSDAGAHVNFVAFGGVAHGYRGMTSPDYSVANWAIAVVLWFSLGILGVVLAAMRRR